jgi:hypothetical protein
MCYLIIYKNNFICLSIAAKPALAPLDAESVFFGGDDWLTLKAQHMAPPE